MNELPAPDPGAFPVVCRYTITIDQYGNPEPYYTTLPRVTREALEELKNLSPDSQFSGTLSIERPSSPPDAALPPNQTIDIRHPYATVWKWTRQLIHGY